MRLSTRLSAFFLAALAAVLVGFSVALDAAAGWYLRKGVEERLDAALAVLAAAAEVHPDGVEWEPEERDLRIGRDFGPERLRWVVLDDRGRRVDRSRNFDDAELTPEWSPRPGETDLPDRLDDRSGQPWRLAQRRLLPRGDAGLPAGRHRRIARALVLTAAVPVGPVDRTLAALGWSLAGTSAATWLVAAALGRGLVRRALAPLSRMVGAAKGLDATDAGWSLPIDGADDELAELGRAFNDLLGRLRVAYERQSRFTGDASHQLRTPLTAMVGQLDLALRRERPPQEYRRVLGLVRGQAGNLVQIVEALLFLGRADADAGLPDAEAVDLAAWLSGHVGAHHLAPAIRLDLPPGPVTARVQPALLGQVVDNLLDNAAKYGEAGAPIVVRLREEGESSALAVEDNGPGIDPADLPRLFEPFFRSDRARRLGRPGVGLGLAVAQRVAVAFGGSIEVASEPGRGSRFTLRLPQQAGLPPISPVVASLHGLAPSSADAGVSPVAATASPGKSSGDLR